MQKKIVISSLTEVAHAAKEVLAFCGTQKKIAFYGQMGAGKTTFIKELCRVIGSKDEANSPTYPIVNEYAAKNGHSIFHIDLYRLDSEEEAFDIGIEEYIFDNNAYCFIEWPQIVEHLLSDFASINISITENNERVINIEKHLQLST
ncbi:MAG: tRNA (adenosine(37)-N6)-threonylcarbamoyltransferase complex ATPase subunit type 1 TsaE [Chitinophagales bacterium]